MRVTNVKRALGAAFATVVTAGVLLPHAPTAVAADRSAPRTVAVDFGDTVEQTTPEEALRLTFAGERGQLVTLRTSVDYEVPGDCESIALSGGGLRVVQHAPGIWRLPATGSYRLDYAQTCEDTNSSRGGPFTASLNLAEVVVGRRGDAMRHLSDPSKPVVRAVSVRLGEQSLLLTDATVVAARRTTPEAEHFDQSGCRISLLTEGTKRGDFGEVCTFRAREGDRYLVFGDEGSRIRTVRTTRARLDGPPVPVGRAPQQITFRGEAGDVVYPEASGLRFGSRAESGLSMTAAGTGERVAPLKRAGDTGRSWVLPASGAYRLLVADHEAKPRAVVRIRSARVVEGKLGADFTVAVGRRWTVAAVDGVDADTWYVGNIVAEDGLSEDWEIRLMSTHDQQWSYPADQVGEWTATPVRPLRGVLIKPGEYLAVTGGTITVRLEPCTEDPTRGLLICPGD